MPAPTEGADETLSEELREPQTPEHPAATPAPARPTGKAPGLATFHQHLRELAAGSRKGPVRVAWLGDSHGQADFWSGRLRSRLQERFGNGGLGFLHLGYKRYRHNGARLTVDGKWAPRPKSLAAGKGKDKYGGAYGLGGLLFRPYGPASEVRLRLRSSAGQGPWKLQLCLRFLSKKDSLRLKNPGLKLALRTLGARRYPTAVGKNHWLDLGEHSKLDLRIRRRRGRPALCGVSVESTKPGVVLDTLAINGARFRTALNWNKVAWIGEAARRDYSLVIFEYGTNEAGDFRRDPSLYGKHLERLLARVRKASPKASCAVIGPTERNDFPRKTPPIAAVLKAKAAEKGCFYWDSYGIMGGKGAIRRWQAKSPPLAAPDGIHLLRAGYLKLGDRLAADLVHGVGAEAAEGAGGRP